MLLKKTFGGKQRGGRPPNRFDGAIDEPLLQEMHQLIENCLAKSPEHAAHQVANKAVGAGTFESKKTRLAKRYRTKFSERK